MKIFNLNKLRVKDLIVFDLDGTLAPTKSPMDREMSGLLAKLLAKKTVAVIGGGKYSIFQMQLLRELKAPRKLLQNLFLFPTTATSFYKYHRGWQKIYSHQLSKTEKRQIRRAFREVFKEIGYVQPQKVYGRVLEDRGTQMTYSFLGQDVVGILGKKKGVAMKEKFKREQTPLKMQVRNLLAKRLPNLEVHAAGYTSVDVTKKGIDKGYGLRQIEKQLGVKISQMLFVGDAIFPGGNDYAITKTPVDYIPVKGPEETKKIIRHILAEK